MATYKKTSSLRDRAMGKLDMGVHALFAREDREFAAIALDQIDVKEQVRKHFDQEAISDLSISIQTDGLINPITVRRRDGRFELVCGERRVRACRLIGKPVIDAMIYNDLSDEKAAALQMAENIHDENLTQFELAIQLDADVKKFGSVENALAKAGYNKSANWGYKLLGLLKMPEQTARLVNEAITSDTEVINATRQIEKHDAVAAKAFVDELKETGTKDARSRVAVVRNRVKQTDNPERLIERALLDLAYQLQAGSTPAKVLKGLTDDQRSACESLKTYYVKGSKRKAGGVMAGLGDGTFSAKGSGALRLAAYLHGLAGGEAFELDDIFKVLH